MAKSVESKREREKKIVSQMIELYCRKNHGAGNHGTDKHDTGKKGTEKHDLDKHGRKNVLCKECQKLKDYALLRSDKCPFMESKTFCSNCKVHCYRKDMREKIKEVMRFSGLPPKRSVRLLV